MSKVLVDRELLERIARDDEGAASFADFEELKRVLAQPAEAEGDRIASGFVILDGMAFSKDEILAQRVDLCNALESLSAVTAERDRLREDRDSQQRACIAEMEKFNQLRAEVEALRKDAERYRWLRGRLPGSAYRIAGVIYSEGGDGVDAAIDAAMAAKEA